MADKEERIIIAVAEPSLLEGGANEIFPSMTRQEAIEVMAKGICKMEDGATFKVYLDQAEAALNALLEGGNK